MGDILNNLILSQNLLPSLPAEYFKYLQYLPVFFVFFFISFLLKPIIGKIATAIDAIDYPEGSRKEKLNRYDQTKGVKAIHKAPTPLLGGVGVLLPIFVATPIFLGFNDLVTPFMIALGILLLVGILDDIYNLPATFQFGGQIFAALVIAISTFDIPFVNNPFGGVLDLNWFEYNFDFITIAWRIIFPGDILLIVWLLLCTNAVKWVGGIGGLLESNMIVAYSLMFILGIRTESLFITLISVMMVGGISGGWIFDFPPAKIFTGSTGKTLFGFIIAALAIVNGAKVAATILILALPLIDAMYVLVQRYRMYKPKNLVELMRINGPMHFHHQLNNMNFTPPEILLIETSIALFFGLLAVLTTGAFKFFLLLAGLLLILLGIIYLNFKAGQKKQEKARKSSEESPESKYSY